MKVEEAFLILELPADSTWEQVRQSYREMVKVWHPDRFAGDEKFQNRATRKVQQINQAFEVLKENYQTQNAAPPPPPKPQWTKTEKIPKPPRPAPQAPPKQAADGAKPARPARPELARRLARLEAYGMDLGVICLLAGFLQRVPVLLYTAWTLLAVINILLLKGSGQSIGSSIMGIQIVDHKTDRNPGFIRAFVVRSLPTWAVFLLGLLLSCSNDLGIRGWGWGLLEFYFLLVLIDHLMIFTDQRRCLHDYIAGTRVVNVSKPG